MRLAQRMFDVPTALVSLIDEDRQFHKAEVGFGGLSEIPRSQSFCTHAIAQPSAFVVTDPEHDERFRDNPLVTGADGIRFYAGQPLFTPSGVAVGALCIIDTKAREIDENQLAILRELADFVETELARTEELDRAGEVQRRLLPRTVPDLPGYEVAGICLPATAVGGDFYDWHPVKDGFQVAIADVMGKGIPAAIIGASVRSLMRGASRFNDLETSLERVAFSMEDDLAETSTFVTLFGARLDPERHELTYVDAGHGIAGIVTHPCPRWRSNRATSRRVRRSSGSTAVSTWCPPRGSRRASTRRSRAAAPASSSTWARSRSWTPPASVLSSRA